MLHSVGKQAYKLKLSTRWRIYNVFYVSLLEKDTTKKGRISKFLLVLEFKVGNNKKYEIEANPKQSCLRQESRRTFTRDILFDCIEKLLRRRKHLEIIFSGYVSLKNGQHLLQKPSREANSNISTPGLCSTHDKANSQALCKVETKTSSKKYYKIC